MTLPWKHALMCEHKMLRHILTPRVPLEIRTISFSSYICVCFQCAATLTSYLLRPLDCCSPLKKTVRPYFKWGFIKSQNWHRRLLALFIRLIEEAQHILCVLSLDEHFINQRIAFKRHRSWYFTVFRAIFLRLLIFKWQTKHWRIFVCKYSDCSVMTSWFCDDVTGWK